MSRQIFIFLCISVRSLHNIVPDTQPGCTWLDDTEPAGLPQCALLLHAKSSNAGCRIALANENANFREMDHAANVACLLHSLKSKAPRLRRTPVTVLLQLGRDTDQQVP